MIPLFSTHIPEHTAEKVCELIKSGWINRGKNAFLFEETFRIKFGYEHVLSVNSATSALRMAYEISKEFGKGKDEVITTPYTMVATNTAILEAGLKPCFVDIQYGTANIDPFKVLDAINERTLAIVGVDYAGYPCDWEDLQVLAKDYNVMLIDDAAHALGAKLNGKATGKYVDMACYSFQAVKHINTGDGGMFVCSRDDIYELAKKKIWFGIDKAKRVESPLGIYPVDIDTLGFKYAMNDIAAVMGLEGLKDFDKVSQRRREIAKWYHDELQYRVKVELMDYEDFNKVHAYWLFPIHVDKRMIFAEYMRSKGIEVAVHNWRNDNYSIFKSQVGRLLYRPRELDQVEVVNKDLIHIPMHAELTDDQVEYIIKTIRSW